MAENSTVVETVFTLVDQASAKVERLSHEFIALQEQAMAAKAAVSKSATVPGGTPTVPAGTGTPAEEAAKAAPRGGKALGEFSAEQVSTFREGQKLERLRQKSASEAADKHNTAARISLGASQLLSGSMEGVGGKMVQMGGAIGGIGIDLAQFGGRVGALGGVLAKLGPLASAAGVAISGFSAAWDSLNSELKLIESDEAKTRHSNYKYAKSLGYRSAAEYEAAQHAHKTSQQQVKLQFAAKKYGADLGSLPANATEKEMNAFNDRLEKASLKILREANLPASMMGEAMREVAKQAEAGKTAQAANMKETMQQDLLMQEAVKKQARYIGALPTNATRAEMEAFNARLLKSGVGLLSSSAFFGVSLEEIIGMLREEASTSIGAATVGLREKTNKELVAQDKEETALKQLNKMELKKGVKSRTAYNEALIRQANDIARNVYGDKATDEQFQQIYRDLRSQSKLDKTKTAFDFRGSRFDIKQSFAEGIEPGDVSVALTNDIAALAERQLTSGFSPIFGGI